MMLRWVSLSDCQDDNYYDYYHGWVKLSDCQADNYYDYYYGWVRIRLIVKMTIIMIIFMDG